MNHKLFSSIEDALEAALHTGLNWAIMSQGHSFSAGHVDTAGVHTGILVLTGHKLWAIRRTLLYPERDEAGNEIEPEIDVDDVEYFVDLAGRSLEDLPGGSAAWVAVLLFPGDILCVLLT